MTNKLVVIINSLKIPKIKKILLYEMRFLVPNYSCLQNPWLGGYRPRSPFSLSSTEFVEPPRTKFLGTPLWFIVVKLSLALPLGILSRLVLMDVSKEPAAFVIKVTICRPNFRQQTNARRLLPRFKMSHPVRQLN